MPIIYKCDMWPRATFKGAATRHGFLAPQQRVWGRVGGLGVNRGMEQLWNVATTWIETILAHFWHMAM